MLLISDRIDWYSWLAAASCDELRVPFEASVASVTARLSRLVTCESAPSATCRRPTPSVALVCDWVKRLLVGLQAVDQRKAGRVVRAGVDLRTGRQLLQTSSTGCCWCCSGCSPRTPRRDYSRHPGTWGSPCWMRGFAALPASAPIFCLTLGCCFRFGTVASGPFFGVGTRGLYHPALCVLPRTLLPLSF